MKHFVINIEDSINMRVRKENIGKYICRYVDLSTIRSK